MTDSIPKEVLVVEDEPLTRMVAADALTDRGIIAWEAGDASEALDVLNVHPRIGVIFTDINMPGDLNGLGLAHEVSVTHPNVKQIVTSGTVKIADKDLPDHGTFLAKPYPTAKLVDMVEKKLNGAGSISGSGPCPLAQPHVSDFSHNMMVGERGFEPPAPASRRQCSTRLSYSPTGTRTNASQREPRPRLDRWGTPPGQAFNDPALRATVRRGPSSPLESRGGRPIPRLFRWCASRRNRSGERRGCQAAA